MPSYFVPWDEVKEHMHIQIKEANTTSYASYVKYTVREEELKKVFNSLGGNNKKAEKPIKKKAKVDMNLNQIHVEDKKPECLMIDGYNMIYDWQDLKDIAKVNIESARDELINRISNYQGYKRIKVILVFDGYRVKNNTDIVNIENLTHLEQCGDELFWFSCFQLKIENCDDFPIRAIA